MLSTGACANINIREIMLSSIISSVRWTLQETELRERQRGGERGKEGERERILYYTRIRFKHKSAFLRICP